MATKRGGPASTAAPTAGLDPVAHERWCWILVALVGQPVTATLKDGVRVTGILAAATPDAGDLSIALRQAVTILPASEGTPAPKPALVLNGKDLVQLEAQDTDIDFAALPPRPQSSTSSSTPAAAATDSFRTDTDISRASQLGKERQLQAWGADASSYGGGGIEDGDDGLEDGLGRSVNGNNGSGKGNAGRRGGPASSSNGGGAWDQFAANERAFGLRTDYDDEIYTTRLDRSTADFKQREARAAQLEREILKGSTSSTSLAYNAHVAEERGEQVADSLDEEERYGAVIRTGTEGAYVPPGARKAALARLQQQQQQQNGGQGQGSPSGAGSGSSGTASPAPPPPPVSSLSASTPAAAAPPAAPTTSPTPTTTKPNPNAKPYDRSMQEFVHSERVRLEQRRAQMQQAQQQSQQQAQLKKEYDSKLASLVQWSQTFKNPYPMPDEVAQILGKKPAGDSKTTATKSATVSPATATTALPPATSAATVASPEASAAAAGKPTAPTTTTKITKAMVLEIPPFDPNRAKAKQAALVAAQKAGTAPALSAAPAAAAAETVPAASTSGTAAPAASSTSKEVKPPAGGAKKLSATSAAFVFKPNPAAASFTPGASNTTTATTTVAAASARRPSATSTAASVAEAAPPPSKVPVNPFFGTKQIKKGSSSMHVKEDFTPFKNGVPPEPSTVPPAWSFTGKPYRSIYPIPPQGSSLDDAAANGMIDPNNAAAIAAAQQQAHAHAAHAFMGGVAGGVPMNMLPGPQHPPPPQQPQAFVAMSSAGGSISGSPASMSMPPPPPPPQAITGGGGPHLQRPHPHPHPHQQPQPQPQQFGMYGGGNGGHAPPPLAPPHHHQFAQQQQQQQQFSPATAAAVAMGYARQPGGGPAPPQQQQQQMAHINAPGPGPQFQPHGHPPPPPPPFFGQPGGGGGGGPGGGGGGASHMPGFVPGPPHGAQMLSSPHMPHAAVHSPRMSVSTQGGRGPPQQQPPMPWTPPPPPPFQQSATPIPNGGPPPPQPHVQGGPGGFPPPQ
ncbi:hypothetical protein RHOSPDRAFT_36730 [Rhodotorula sp. JG-1b]|nr:hypothetical protein RHOSPDRAFT_36730 [Rhodotorula sp. JG-1b]